MLKRLSFLCIALLALAACSNNNKIARAADDPSPTPPVLLFRDPSSRKNGANTCS